MFVAIDQHGNRLNPIDTPEEDLRLLSRSKLIFCPECKTHVRFASGEQVTAHFKHDYSPDCNYESEPETEEHLNGKILIRNWLLEQYPDVQVEFEYKIKETNQRADVMAIFPSGKKVAFEMQCSKIQGSAWKERRNLYKKAGIKDYWILGKSVHKFGKTDGKEDTTKHQLVSLASSIFKTDRNVIFLDTHTLNVTGLYSHKIIEWHSDTILKLEAEVYPLSEAKIFKDLIATEVTNNHFQLWLEEQLRLEGKYKRQQEEFRREQEKKERENKEAELLRENSLKQYLSDLGRVTLLDIKEKMTRHERELFERLLKKHGYNDENFPGIFNVLTSTNFLIYTPTHLWQLWIFDKYIYRRKNINDKIWIPKVKDEFYKMYQKGIFRFKHKMSDYYFSFAIYDYFQNLNDLDIVERLGQYTTKYHQINYDTLPSIKDKNFDYYISYYFSAKNESQYFDQSDLSGDIEEAVILYKSIIKEHSEGKQINNHEEISILEYTNNLLLARSELGNDWERDFISKMLGLVKRGFVLTEKQQNRVAIIVNRLEKELGISLTLNG